ncbi:Signal transduction histidine kinase [Roseivivax lentus]|uniref:histidine kinase n=1 Tax=Roseivivax lentus TaxID=633194 RepID=A0A1N7PBY2_9RHOB|nr:HAMP domain-containing sensor histidine kinase [Roseivivax lentus]SIT08026.1 Signal transduction histidine kinase [Roseivivax lentus]
MTRHAPSLRFVGMVLVLLAFAAGAVTAWAWVRSDARWQQHRAEAYVAGLALYATLQTGTAAPTGMGIVPLSADDQRRADAGDFLQLSRAPQVVRTTIVPILPDPGSGGLAQALTLVILSPDIVYPIAPLQQRTEQTAAETAGGVLRLLATYCSDPVVLARTGTGPWSYVEGGRFWNCAAAPADLRLWAAMGAAIALAGLLTVLLNTTAHFTDFATRLRSRRRLDGPESYDTDGPKELQDIVTAVNTHLEAERAQLAARAAVLSGVSHDLGTPATRLRLRTALIEDAELRGKLEQDIDSMTGMIESVLTYTRAEMNAEEPRPISLQSLVEAIVADYEDIGKPVRLRPPRDVVLQGAQSVFMSRRGSSVISGDHDIVVRARPISLQRAICNLIDNALKYGRRSTVGLETDAASVTITVEDEGTASTAKDIEKLMAPFTRGDNTAAKHGYGLGLTIVNTIASLHGGALSFEDTPTGITARLTIARG